MLKIYNSEQNPAAFVVTLHENQFRNEQVDGEISMDERIVTNDDGDG
jgi:hypothetical protein